MPEQVLKEVSEVFVIVSDAGQIAHPVTLFSSEESATKWIDNIGLPPSYYRVKKYPVKTFERGADPANEKCWRCNKHKAAIETWKDEEKDWIRDMAELRAQRDKAWALLDGMGIEDHHEEAIMELETDEACELLEGVCAVLNKIQGPMTDCSTCLLSKINQNGEYECQGGWSVLNCPIEEAQNKVDKK